MTVAMGNDSASTVIDANGKVQPNRAIPMFTDKALTSPATGLTDENGATIAAPVSGPTGVLSFGAPDGTTGLWYNRGDGKGSVIRPTTILSASTPTGNRVRTQTLTVIGDSVGAGSGDNVPIWTQRIATAQGKAFYKLSYAGQASEMFFRAGSEDLTTDNPVTLPAGTTATTATFVNGGLYAWAPVAYDGSSGKPGFTCVAKVPNGPTVPCTLFKDASANASTNTQPVWTVSNLSGAAITLPAGTVFHCTEADAHVNDDLLIVGGTNFPGTVPGDTTGSIFIRHITNIRRYWGNDRIYLMGTHMRPGDPTPQPIKIYFNAVNKAKMGSRFIDIMQAVAPATATGYSIGYGMSYMGVTPSADDLTKLANGQVPTSVMSDGTHPGPALYQLMQDLTLQAMATNDDYIGAAPKVTALATATAPTTANATSSTVDVTPAAVTGANGYSIQNRVLGATTWISGPNTSGSAVTVTGLNSGTSYQFRAVPVDLRGYGTASASVTAATTGTAPTVLMSDSFSGADTTTINARTPDLAQGGTARAWATNNAFLGIVSGVLTEPDVSGRQTTGLFDPAVTDGRCAVTIKALPSAGLTMTIYVRCTTYGSGYYAVVITDVGLVRLNKHDGTTATTLATLPAGTAVVGDRWEVRAVGTAISAIQNGATVLTATDSTVTTGTKVGVNLQRAAAIDDLVFWDK